MVDSNDSGMADMVNGRKRWADLQTDLQGETDPSPALKPDNVPYHRCLVKSVHWNIGDVDIKYLDSNLDYI